MNRDRKLYLEWHILFLLLSFYCFCFATHFKFQFGSLKFMDHYQLQANGFYFLKPFLLSFDGGAPPAIDTSIYGGRPYGVYGPLPSIFQLLLNNILKLDIPSSAIVFTLTLSCLYAFFWLGKTFFEEILELNRKWAVTLSALICSAIAITDRFLQNVVVGFSWTQASVTSQLFLILSFIFFLKFLSKEKKKFLFWSGLFYGFACLGKQNYLLGFIPTAIFIIYKFKKKALSKLKFYLSPILGAFILNCIWNFIRFKNPFDSGLLYVNATEINPNHATMPQFHRIPYNFFNHFLSLAKFDTKDFPLLSGQTSPFGGMNLQTGAGGLLHNFQMISMFVSSPILLVLPIFCSWLLWEYFFNGRKLNELDKWWIYLMGTNFFVFFYYLITDSSWSRYQFDIWFLSYLGTALVLVRWFGWLKKIHQVELRKGSFIFCTLTLIFSIFTGLDQTMGLLVNRTNPFIYKEAYRMPSDQKLTYKVCLMRSAFFRLNENCYGEVYLGTSSNF